MDYIELLIPAKEVCWEVRKKKLVMKIKVERGMFTVGTIAKIQFDCPDTIEYTISQLKGLIPLISDEAFEEKENG